MTKQGEHGVVGTTPAANGQMLPADSLVRMFNELRDELLSALVFVLGNREDAKDASQEAFLKCWNARDQLDQVVNLRGWIFRVCFNTAKDMRKSAWNRKAKRMSDEQYTLASQEKAPQQLVEADESLEQLKQAIQDLRSDEKEVFLMRQNGDLTYEQIASLRGCPVGTVKSQMRSALDKLRKMLVS